MVVLSTLESCLAVLSIFYTNYKKSKTMLLALSWEFPKLTISLLTSFLSTGCPFIHEYCTNSLFCATTNQSQRAWAHGRFNQSEAMNRRKCGSPAENKLGQSFPSTRFQGFKVLLSFLPLGAKKRSYIRTRHSLWTSTWVLLINNYHTLYVRQK